jgi:hypothetical protein
MELADGSSQAVSILASRLGIVEAVALSASVARQFAKDGVGVALKDAGDGAHAPTLLTQRCQGQALFWFQVCVVCSLGQLTRRSGIALRI